MLRTTCAIAAALGTAFVTGAAAGPMPLKASPTFTEPTALVTTNGMLRASLERIAAGSALWRSGIEAVRRSGRKALVVTSDQVVVTDTRHSEPTEAFDSSVLAEVAPIADANSKVDVVLVVVNLALLERLHERKGSLPGELHADLDRILVHEIYGHALPYLLSGDLSGRCADPLPRQRPIEACSIQRENAVRAELGLGRRTDYGVHGLAVARGGLP